MIADVYQRLIEVVAETFPDKVELTNPYVIDDNEDIFLKSGFGVAILPTVNLNRATSCLYSIGRDVEIVFTKQIFGTNRDHKERQAIEKGLMQDQLNLIKAIDNDGQLNDLLANSAFIGDNGIEFIFNDRNNFVALTCNFTLEYHEQI